MRPRVLDWWKDVAVENSEPSPGSHTAGRVNVGESDRGMAVGWGRGGDSAGVGSQQEDQAGDADAHAAALARQAPSRSGYSFGGIHKVPAYPTVRVSLPPPKALVSLNLAPVSPRNRRV
jgi:hypothetical protein